jgi:hypothetical protein
MMDVARKRTLGKSEIGTAVLKEKMERRARRKMVVSPEDIGGLVPGVVETTW